jgi:hypothetical protein
MTISGALGFRHRWHNHNEREEARMIPSTVERVPLNTVARVNESIRRRTDERVARLAAAGPNAIATRLAELDQEWDIERTLEANAAAVSLLTVMFGAAANKKWFIMTGVVAGFLLQHALEGWCPPLPILRRFGFRTQSEIGYERYALKALRGDFRDLPERSHDESDAARIVETMRH